MIKRFGRLKTNEAQYKDSKNGGWKIIRKEISLKAIVRQRRNLGKILKRIKQRKAFKLKELYRRNVLIEYKSSRHKIISITA